MAVLRSVWEPDIDAGVNVIRIVLANYVEHRMHRLLFASTGGAIYGEQQMFRSPRTIRSIQSLPIGSPR